MKTEIRPNPLQPCIPHLKARNYISTFPTNLQNLYS